MSIARSLAHRWDRLTGRVSARQRAAQHAFDRACATLGAEDLTLDLGANAGIYTEKLARSGAQVAAFEPDPAAFALLSDRVAAFPNVTCHQAAMGPADGEMQLYRTADFARDPARHSTSSSLIADKRNVGSDGAVTVKVIDAVRWLTERDRDIALIKMDIEGAEVDLMEALLDAPVARRIGQIFVETHERAIPRLADRTDALKQRTAQLSQPLVNWDWH